MNFLIIFYIFLHTLFERDDVINIKVQNKLNNVQFVLLIYL